MRPRLLYLVGQLRPGGLERQLHCLLSHLDLTRYPSAVVVWRYDANDFYVERLAALGVRLHAFPPDWSGLRKLLRLIQVVRTTQPEVVHSYSFHTNFAAWWASWFWPVVSVGSYRSDCLTEIKNGGRILGPLCARLPRTIIANSQGALRNARTLSWMRPQRLALVRNGVDLALFSPEVPLPVTPTMIGIGTLNAEKRWDRILKACGVLRREGLEFRLKLVGDGPARGELTGLASNLGLGDCVDFLGQRADVPRLLAEASCLVHASDREGCPNVVVEAMAAGRAVLAMDVGDIPDIVEDGQTGFVVRRGDDPTFATRLRTLVMDRQLCERMGSAARQRAELEFRLERLVDQTLEVYRAAGWHDVGVRPAPGQRNLLASGR